MKTYFVLAKLSVVVYFAMSCAAYAGGDWRRGTLALLFSIANMIMFVL